MSAFRSVVLARRCVIGLVAMLLVAGVVDPSSQEAALDDVQLAGEVLADEPMDETAAMEAALATGSPVVVPAAMSSTRKVTALPDGLFKAQISPMPVRTLRDGEWADLDPTLVVGENGRLVPRVGDMGLSISPGGSEDLIRFGDATSGESVALTWPTALPQPTVDGRLATYAEVMGGVDLVVESGATGFSTYLVVKDRLAAQNPALSAVTFGMRVDDLSVVSTPRGQVEFRAADGSVPFAANAPRMWDARDSEPSAPSGVAELIAEVAGSRAATVAMEASSSALTLRPDRAWMLDPATEFPVVIDPDFASRDESNSGWTMVWSNGVTIDNSSSQAARVGYDGWSSATKKSRSFFRFAMTFFNERDPDANTLKRLVKSGTLTHKQIHSPSWTCDTTLGPAVAVWRTDNFGTDPSWPGPGLNHKESTNDKAHGHRDYCPGSDLNDWNVTDAVKWAQDEPRLVLGMVSDNETNRDGWRQYADTSSLMPELVILYNSVPVRPAAPKVVGSLHYAPEDRWYTRESMPTITATISDPNGDQVQARFQILTGSTVVRDITRPLLGSGQQVTWDMGASLAAGGYRVLVQGIDVHGDAGPWSDATLFMVDLVNPDPPTFSWGAGKFVYGSAKTFTFTSSSTDVAQFKYGFTTSTPAAAVSVSGSTPSANVTYTPNVFGPDWVTAIAVDRSGRTSASASTDFQVYGAGQSDRWPLNAGGNNVKNVANVLTLNSPAWGPGRWQEYPDGVIWAAGDQAMERGAVGGALATAPGDVVNLDASVTMSAWVWLPATTTNTQIAVARVGQTNSMLQLGYSVNGWVLQLREADNQVITVKQVAAAPGEGNWVHLLGVYVSPRSGVDRRIELYVDGEPAGSALVEKVLVETGELWIGANKQNGGSANRWEGGIDDVRLFPGAIDPIGALVIAHEAALRDGGL